MSMMMSMMAAQMRGGGPPAQLIGTAATSDTFIGTDFTVAVPVGAQTGDTLVAILRCRADRTFTVPGGWTTSVNGVTVGTSGTTASNTKLYVIHKAFAGETSLTFVQSASAAGLVVCAAVRGTIGGVSSQNDAASISRAPVNSRSMMLSLGTSNATPDASATWGAPFPAGVSYKWSATANYFYGTSLSNLSTGGTASVTATYTWDSNNPGSNFIWLAEILPPA